MRLPLLALAVCLPGTVLAQRITITPQAGAYTGLTRQTERRFGGDCPFVPPCYPTGTARTRILPSPFLGFTIASRTNGLGFEGSFGGTLARSHSYYRLDGDSTWFSEGTGVGVTTVTALRLTLTRPLGPDRSIVFGAGGAIRVLHEELRLHSKENEGHLGASFSTKLRFLTAGRRVVELGLVSMVYSISTDRDERLQHDVMVTFGLGMSARR